MAVLRGGIVQYSLIDFRKPVNEGERAMAPMFLTAKIGTKIGWLSQASSPNRKNVGKQRNPGGVCLIYSCVGMPKMKDLLMIRDGLLLAMPPLSDGRA